jgi:hypothetical protein
MTPRATPDAVVRLEAEITVGSDALAVRAQVRNAGRTAIFVFNEPWLPTGPEYAPAPDPARAFRFVDKATLALLIGVPPLPPNRHVHVAYKPYATRVAASGSLDIHFTASLPTKEYNPYYAEDSTAHHEDVVSREIVLIVQYLTETAGVTAQPALWPWASAFFAVMPISAPGGFYPGEQLVASASVPPFHVARRAGDFARIPMPALL